jgi:hypothetical protein
LEEKSKMERIDTEKTWNSNHCDNGSVVVLQASQELP